MVSYFIIHIFMNDRQALKDRWEGCVLIAGAVIQMEERYH